MTNRDLDYIGCISANHLESAGYEGSVLCKRPECEFGYKVGSFCTNQGRIPFSKFKKNQEQEEKEKQERRDRREINDLEKELVVIFNVFAA
jgi:hypothetical protein